MREETRHDEKALEQHVEEATDTEQDEAGELAIWERLARSAPRLTLLGLAFLESQAVFPNVWGGGKGGHGGH